MNKFCGQWGEWVKKSNSIVDVIYGDNLSPEKCGQCFLFSPSSSITEKAMMDHESERSRDSHWEVEQNNTVRFIRERLGLDFSEREINHVIGLLEVNAFEVTGRGRGRGVFPLTALMSHCCISNTR